MIINIIVAVIISYLIISIFKKKLPLPTRYEQYNYEGKRAGFLSVGFLFIFIYLITLENMESFNFVVFLISFMIGTPIALFLHSQLSKNSGTIVLEKTEQRKVTVSNLILYGILGIFVGFVTSMFAFPISLILGFTPLAVILISVFTFLITIILVARWGTKSSFGGYVNIAMVKKSDEEEVKEILEKNNIPYIIRPLFKKNETFVSDKQLVKVLINEGYENKALELLENLIDTEEHRKNWKLNKL